MLTRKELEERSGVELEIYENIILDTIKNNIDSRVKFEDGRLINAIKHIHENVDAWAFILLVGTCIGAMEKENNGLREAISHLNSTINIQKKTIEILKNYEKAFEFIREAIKNET